MPGPWTFRNFRKLTKEYGCRLERTRNNEWRVIRESDGKTISTFAVTHGKSTKAGEIKLPYVRNFQKRIDDIEGNEE